MPDESKMQWIGTCIRKEFEEGLFKGIVVSYKEPYYVVKYDDGDAEEISLTEILKLRATERKRLRESNWGEIKKVTHNKKLNTEQITNF